MPEYSFDQLKNPPSEESLLAKVLSWWTAAGFTVTAWQSGDTGRTIAHSIALGAREGVTRVASAARNIFLTSDADEDWAVETGRQFFGEERLSSVETQGVVLVTDSANTGPHNIAAGALWVSVGSTGQRYVSIASATVPLGGSASIAVQAESAGAEYNVSVGSINVVGVAGYPGITVSNPAASPTATVVATGTAVGPADVFFKVVSGGTVSSGSCAYALSTNGGATFGSTQALPGSGLLTVSGVTFAFAGTLNIGDVLTADLATGLPAGAVNYLSAIVTANSWITRAGRDLETVASLSKRCGVYKWNTLSKDAPYDAYKFWAFAASAQVTKVSVRTGVPATGIVTIVLAGPSGTVSSAVVEEVKAYISTRAGLTSFPAVLAATPVTISLVGVVYVTSAQLANAQAAVERSVSLLAEEIDMGGSVYRSELIQRIMDAPGVSNVQLTTPSVDQTLAASEAVSFNTSGLTWVVV